VAVVDFQVSEGDEDRFFAPGWGEGAKDTTLIAAVDGSVDLHPSVGRDRNPLRTQVYGLAAGNFRLDGEMGFHCSDQSLDCILIVDHGLGEFLRFKVFMHSTSDPG
jgi:hypothetical protein